MTEPAPDRNAYASLHTVRLTATIGDDTTCGWTPIGHVDADALDWTPLADPALTAQAYAGLDTTTPRRITIGLDVSAAVRAFRGLAEAIMEFDRLMSSPAGAGIKQALAALEDSQQRAQRRVHVAYRARQIARRRRNRG